VGGWGGVEIKEVNKEQPSYRNLSATATRVPQCTRYMPSCSFSERFFSYSHLTSDYTVYTHKKYNKIFIIYKEIQQGSGAKSYVTEYWLYHSPAEQPVLYMYLIMLL
jgi:hypothetical protein